jgi:protoporphyrinogen oxidase
MKYAVIGSGMSGLAISNILKDHNHEVIVFEAESRSGGLIKCDIVEGSLFHRTGGHVFNTKRQDVFEWFWKHFDRHREFIKTERNASVSMENGQMIPYPIENHIYLFEGEVLKSFVNDLLHIAKSDEQNPSNFEEFLRGRFGDTLYNIYFQPYNYKIWRRDLTKIPLLWLEGKLPMPTIEDMIFNNIAHVKENSFVHSSFFYPQTGGSQFLADRLSQGLNIKYNTKIERIENDNKYWIVDGYKVDKVIFCGNIKQLQLLLGNFTDLSKHQKGIDDLEFHGTTSVFCEIDSNPYSWIYMPSKEYEAHRIICTGNFVKSNNAIDKMTATIEFTDYISRKDILLNLKKIHYNPMYLTHHYAKYTYPIQNATTRRIVNEIKSIVEKQGIYLLGRFAEWEYYNMDASIGAALDLYKNKLREIR